MAAQAEVFTRPELLFSGSMFPECSEEDSVRPLGEVSDLAVNVSAYITGLQPAGLFGAIETVVDRFSQSHPDTNALFRELTAGDRFELALFDLLFLQSAVFQTNQKIPENLRTVIGQFLKHSGRTVTAATYDDFVRVNPLAVDPRIFFGSTGTGLQEYHFYVTHFLIENHMEHILEAMQSAVDSLKEGRVERAVDVLHKVGMGSVADINFAEEAGLRNDATEVFRLMTYVGTLMDKGSFDVFRGYFNSPDPKFDGASGKYTDKIPRFELLLAGDKLKNNRQKFIVKSMPYHAQAGQEHIRSDWRQADRKETLDALCERLGDPPELLAVLYGLDYFLLHFRELHTMSVLNKLPEVLTGEVAPTGRTKNVKKFFEHLSKPLVERRYIDGFGAETLSYPFPYS